MSFSQKPIRPSAAAGRARRVWALITKEVRQVIRDPSSIAIGIVMPVFLILLFGYGMSLDVTHVPVALVLEDPSPAATDLAASFELSPYFDAVRMSSMRDAEQRMLARKVDGTISAEALAIKSVASPMATPGFRLKEIVILVN